MNISIYLFFSLIGLLSIVGYYLYTVNKKNKTVDIFERETPVEIVAFLFLVFFFYFVIFLFAIPAVVLKETYSQKNRTVKREIVSLTPSVYSDTNITQGIFLISITGSSNNGYLVMEKLGENKFVKKEIPGDAIVITTATPETAYMTYKVCDPSKSKYFDLLSGKWENGCLYDQDCMPVEEEYDFNIYVPKNAIQHLYKAN